MIYLIHKLPFLYDEKKILVMIDLQSNNFLVKMEPNKLVKIL